MSQQTITVQPNATQAVSASGKFLNIISCTAAFKVEMDRGGQVTAVAGSQFSSEQPFSRLVFSETQGGTNTITFDASDTPSPGRATLVQTIASTFTGDNSGHYDLGSAGSPKSLEGLIFPGVNSGKSRKAIYITNLGLVSIGGSASTAVVVVGQGGTTVNFIYAVIQPNQTLAIETSSDIQLFAYTATLSGPATHLMVGVLEIFYSKPLQTDQ